MNYGASFMNVSTMVPGVFALVGAPLLLGVTNRTKAVFAGRNGPPLLQPYYDLGKLLGKGAVYSRTTTWVFRAGPVIGLAAVLVATALLPFGGCRAPLSFEGDLILFAYLLGLARVFTVLAALDTGSAFEGMGASREVLFSTLTEPSLMLALAVVARQTDSLSLSDMHLALSATASGHSALLLVLVAVVLLVVFLAENSRIPVDDPNTHLELTMIHEVMVLDHGGPDFAMILYAAALKLWLFGALIVDLVIPARGGLLPVDVALALAGMLVLAVLLGVIESAMARLRMMRVPELLVGAATLAGLALVLEYGGVLS
jgi:formate hydrogenlyase subunit 4